MTTCLLVGGPPQSVKNYLESKEVTTQDAPLDPPTRITADLVVLHIPASPVRKVQAATKTWEANLTLLQDWLTQAGNDGARAGLTISGSLSGDVTWLLFDRAVHPVMPLNAGAEADPVALDLFLSGLPDVAEDESSAIAIGRFFTPSRDFATYRKQRFLSLSGAEMQPFLQQLQDAVHAMSGNFPTNHAKYPPWKPAGGLTAEKKLGTVPSLGDVFRLHDSPEAQKYFARSHRGWSSPKLLVRGESGSGKTLVAKLVYDLISRRVGAGPKGLPFETVNCASLTPANLTHELFGAAERAWTGIDRPVVGTIARAGYGVAFFDEIGDLDPSVQRAMLVFLSDGMIRPFQIEPYPGFVRIIAATNRDVPLLIEKQKFRNDLNQRFSLQIEIPPLRARGEIELETLIDFVALNPQRNPWHESGLEVTHIGLDAMAALKHHEYRDGNFRELEAIVHDGISRARRRRSRVLRARDLSFSDPHVTNDRDAYLIDITDAPNGPYLDVKQDVDLPRIADLAAAPILRTPDHTRFVVTRDAVFRFLPPGTPDAEE